MKWDEMSCTAQIQPASAAREIALHFNARELVTFKRIDEEWLYE